MLLIARFRNVGEWKAILNAIKDIVDEAMFICNDDGITFRGMDPSHVALLDITFPISSFEKLDSKTSFFGLRIEDFQNVINSAGNNDLIELMIEDNDKMKIKIDGSLKMEYNLRLIEKTEVNNPIPRVDVKSKIGISPNTLSRIISNIENIADHIQISSLMNKVEFYGKGDISDARIDLDKSNPDLDTFEIQEESTSAYSLEYMAKIIRDIGKASKNVNMEYGSNTPLKILFEMPSKTTVYYYLAPKVEN